MARPKSDNKRNAIMSAATRVIAAQGLSAPTASIAKAAGVSNGSLFTYFPTKTDLLNQLYVELKKEMATAATTGLPAEANSRTQMLHIWNCWLHWATSFPEKRRTLAQLGVSDNVGEESHAIAGRTMAGIVALLEQCRANGPMRNAPLGLVAALMSALADTTTDFMIRQPDDADRHSAAGFEALWRIIT